MPEKLKLDEDGHVVTKEVGGVLMPVYTDGKKEETYDPPSMKATIKTQAEDLADVEKTSGKEVTDAKKALRAWERIGPIKEVRAAMQTVKSLADGDVDAAALPAELTETKAQRDALQEQLDEANDKIKTLDSENYELTVGNEISTAMSELDVIDGFTPREARKLWGSNFKREDGKVLAYSEDGKPIMIVDGDGKPRHATTAEALDQLIPKTFRKASGAKGSDATSEHTAHTSGNIRSKADLKTPADKTKYIDEHGREAFEKLPLGSAPS